MPDAGQVPGAATHRPMRVLHVIDSLGAGGAERALVTLCHALRKLGVHVEVAVLSLPHTLAPELEAGGIPVHDLQGRSRPGPVAAGRLRRLVRRGGYDVVHTHLFNATVTAAVAWRGSPARVVQLHNLGYEAHPARSPAKVLRKRLEAFLLRTRFQARVGVSKAAADHYAQELGLPDVTVIPNPVGKPPAQPPLDAGLFGAKAGDRLGVTVGRLSPEKGQDVLLHALAAGRFPALRWVIAGEGPTRAGLASLVEELGLGGTVAFAGRMTHDEVLRLLAAADVVVVPSRSEGMGLVAVEALLLGRCVVASRTGGLAQVVVDGVNGVHAKPGDPADLAAVLGRVLGDDGLRHRLGAAAGDSCASFEPERVARQWLHLYAGCAKAVPMGQRRGPDGSRADP